MKPRGLTAIACGVGMLLVLVLAYPEAAQAQEPIDLVILGCTIEDGPTPDTIDLVLNVGVPIPQTGAWDVPIAVFFNGQPVEPVHHHLTIEKNFLQSCQQTFPNCQLPVPCGFTKWSYKGRGPFFDNWRCLANFNTNACDCVDPGPPFPHKNLPRPTISSFFDIFVDLDNVFPETDETNNHCRVFFAGPTPTLPRSWGEMKDLYYR